MNIDQSAIQIAGNGGNGGDHNIAAGGDVSSSASGAGSDLVSTGDNSAGNGGDGYFFGSLVHAPIVIYMPINIAIAGYNSTADAHQTNDASFYQSAVQIAGIGGDGGNGNVSIGGNVTASGFGSGDSGAISTGGNQAGNGGDGFFHGSISHASFVLYDPINIVMAGNNSSAHADQMNNVDINQSAVQMAGIGGNGGHGNIALGGSVDIFSSGFGFGSDAINTGHNGAGNGGHGNIALGGSVDIFSLASGFGSDAINTGHNSAGNGGSGHFSGSLSDTSVAIYAPINIAIAGYGSVDDAFKANHVHFDPSAIAMAALGGDGGHGNLALGGDVAAHLLPEHHLLLG